MTRVLSSKIVHNKISMNKFNKTMSIEELSISYNNNEELSITNDIGYVTYV